MAHKPIIIDGGPTTAQTAHAISDTEVSQVAYHTCTEAQPELWLRFNLLAGQQVDLQMGVPKIARLETYRPAMALVGPGLPGDALVPFLLPAGTGALVFPTEGTTPVVFDEEFTGTVSWQWPQQHVIAPEAGAYYLVAYSPTQEDGKFWVAIGTAEQFGLRDILTLPRTLFDVRTFHETTPFGGILGWAMLILAGLLALLGFLLW
jgi:hypothetical protein